MGYNLGLKLVRGAYMNEERLLAKENNAESPICETLEDTHSNYDTIMTHAIKNVQPNSIIFVASHNQTTIELAKNLIKENGFNDHRVRFG